VLVFYYLNKQLFILYSNFSKEDKMIITKAMVIEALEFVVPSAEVILATEFGTTWGPRWVEGFIDIPGLLDFPFRFGKKTEWNSTWGEEKNFSVMAMRKLRTAKRLRMNTGIAITRCPWLFQEGDYLYSGGVYREGIACGVSGAKGWVDEGLAEMVVSSIIILAQLETDARKEWKEMKI